jgi:hypothetical protein
MSKRFIVLKRDVKKSIVDNDAFGFRTQPTINEPISPNQFRFVRDPEKVVLFLQWLQKQIDKGILDLYYGIQVGEAVEQQWTNLYVRAAYEKGIERARIELVNAGYALSEAALAGALISPPIHIDRIGLLYTRVFNGLKGITDEMSKQISTILAEGMSRGEGPLEIARRIRNITFEIIGDGEEMPFLKRKIEEYNLTIVKLEGGVDKESLTIKLRRGHLFLFTSRLEGTPTVLLEALACGLPIVTTNAGGVGQILKHNINGYVVEDPYDVDLFVQFINKLYVNKLLAQKMSVNNQQLAEQYAWDVVSTKITEIMLNG